MCVAGTRWVQNELLEKYPEADLEVHAIWFNMFPGDQRRKWPEDLLTDPRVRHYWDEGKAVGRLFGERITRKEKGIIEWDAFVLFGPDATWESTGPGPVVSWGRTIVGARNELRDDLLTLIAKDGPKR